MVLGTEEVVKEVREMEVRVAEEKEEEKVVGAERVEVEEEEEKRVEVKEEEGKMVEAALRVEVGGEGGGRGGLVELIEIPKRA